ncbi:MAG: SOS response-associated peptidase [Acidimicrobiales bacterium]
MCGRYTSTTPVAELARFFAADEVIATDVGPRYNVAPTHDVYAVVSRAGRTALGMLRWGLVPPWARGPRVGSRMINARAESVLDKPAFRSSFTRRRCLVPADGFYEWQANGSGTKQPWYFAHRDGDPLAFAGLWESWRPKPGADGGADRIVSCTIITTTANEALAPVHGRMPALLGPVAWEAWLDPANHDVEALHAMLVPAADDLLLQVPVRRLVNDVANDGPALVEPLRTDDEAKR